MRLIFRVSLILAVFSLSFVYGANAPKCAALQNWDDVFGVLYNDKAAVQAAVDTGITLANIYNIPAIVTSFKEEKELGDHDVTCAGGPSTKKGVFKCVTNLDGNTKYQIGKTCYASEDPSAADPNAADPNAADPNADVKKPETTERTIILYCLLGIAIVVVVGGLACFVWKKSAAPLQIQNKDAEPNAMRDLEEGWKYSGDHHGSVVEEIELQDLKPANDSQVASDASVDVGNDARQ
eukprot:302974_1